MLEDFANVHDSVIGSLFATLSGTLLARAAANAKTREDAPPRALLFFASNTTLALYFQPTPGAKFDPMSSQNFVLESESHRH